MNKPLYLVAFPDFGKLGVQLPNGFEDCSDNGDLCPSFVKEYESGLTLSIMIDYADESLRISEGECREDAVTRERFVCNMLAEKFNTYGLQRCDIATDDWSTVLQWVSDNEAMT